MVYKTPTLLNANFNAPYFHDGRYDTFDRVVAHFDRVFELSLSPQDRSELVAYLEAVGDGSQPYERDGVTARLTEINDFASILAVAIPGHDVDVIALAVQTIGRELRELTEQFPGIKDTTVEGGSEERLGARKALNGPGTDRAANPGRGFGRTFRRGGRRISGLQYACIGARVDD
jgi:hypothetical protein